MSTNFSIVVTSISAPNDVLRSLASGATQYGHSFYVVGDVSSPPTFELSGCTYIDIDAQHQTGFKTSRRCPVRHYARKNVGYLQAIRDGADVIVETDDDNHPRKEFWATRSRRCSAPVVDSGGWVNVYRYFSDENIWPRGLPLGHVRKEVVDLEQFEVKECDCPIQQGLADDNPDVDAIYRLTLPLPLTFRTDTRLVLGKSNWCPFNSQNTTIWRPAFPLLYLPAFCSFRMTDIWRSFIAQRICWENDWHILFHGPSVWQERNEHNLMKDFQDEIPGYLNNQRIADILSDLSLCPGETNIYSNMMKCYESLVQASIFPGEELDLLQAWLADLSDIV